MSVVFAVYLIDHICSFFLSLHHAFSINYVSNNPQSSPQSISPVPDIRRTAVEAEFALQVRLYWTALEVPRLRFGGQLL